MYIYIYIYICIYIYIHRTHVSPFVTLPICHASHLSHSPPLTLPACPHSSHVHDDASHCTPRVSPFETLPLFWVHLSHVGDSISTGDLGIIGESGAIEYHGRADRQVKIGGVRIELGEAEAVCLRRFPTLLNVAIEKIGERLVGVASSRPSLALPSAGELQVALTYP